MSHTNRYLIDGVQYVVHHNGDWSGDATIHSDHVSWSCDIKLPGQLLKVIARRAALDEIVELIEGLE